VPAASGDVIRLWAARAVLTAAHDEREHGWRSVVADKAPLARGAASASPVVGGPLDIDPTRHKQRNVVESAINKFKLPQAAATGYHKREYALPATPDIESGYATPLHDPGDTPYCGRSGE
jgi:hypothetical protein